MHGLCQCWSYACLLMNFIGNNALRKQGNKTYIKTVNSEQKNRKTVCRPENVLKIFWCQQHFHGYQSPIKNLPIGWALQEIQILFVRKALVYKRNQKNRRKLDCMHPLMQNQKKSRWEARKFWKCAKRTNLNSGPIRFELCVREGIMNCVLPVRILHSIFFLSQHIEVMIEPSKMYLSSLDILFLFSLAGIIYF